LLKPGSRVDLQAVSDRNRAAVLRTILQNIEVLSSSVQPEALAGRPATPAVTVLVRPEDADLVAMADTGSRLRLTLRNREDQTRTPTPSLTISALFSDRVARE